MHFQRKREIKSENNQKRLWNKGNLLFHANLSRLIIATQNQMKYSQCRLKAEHLFRAKCILLRLHWHKRRYIGNNSHHHLFCCWRRIETLQRNSRNTHYRTEMFDNGSVKVFSTAVQRTVFNVFSMFIPRIHIQITVSLMLTSSIRKTIYIPYTACKCSRIAKRGGAQQWQIKCTESNKIQPLRITHIHAHKHNVRKWMMALRALWKPVCAWFFFFNTIWFGT